MSKSSQDKTRKRARMARREEDDQSKTKRVQPTSASLEDSPGVGRDKKGATAVPVAQSEIVGLNFPISHSLNALKRGKYSSKVGAAAPVYITAVLEYLVTEILELAGHVARSPEANRELAKQILQREGRVSKNAQRLLEQAARIASQSEGVSGIKGGSASLSATQKPSVNEEEEKDNASAASDVTITPEHIQYILNNDVELRRLIETLKLDRASSASSSDSDDEEGNDEQTSDAQSDSDQEEEEEEEEEEGVENTDLKEDQEKEQE